VTVDKAIHYYCNYQERCHQEVRNKLYELGCNKTEVEEYISDLVSSGIINEERYARAYARGKFKMKQWGKNKIKQQLKLKKISEYCIKKGLSEIDNGEYLKVLKKQSEKKWKELKGEKRMPIKKSKLYHYLLQKGYEYDLIEEIIKELIINENV